MTARFAYMSKAVRMTTDVLITDDIIELERQLDIKHYCRDAVFLLGTDTYRVVRKLQYANGEYLWRWRGNYCTLLDDYEIILRGGLLPVGIGKHTIVFTDRAYAVEQGWIEPKNGSKLKTQKFFQGAMPIGKEMLADIICPRWVGVLGHAERRGVKNTPIREYNEGMAVEIDVHEGRLVLRAFCEAGFNSTLLDILDILEYLKHKYPHVWGGIPTSASQK